MIDSIHIRLKRTLVSNARVKSFTEKILTKQVYNDSKFFEDETEPYEDTVTIGNFKNFNVSIGSKHIKINGSLPEYIYGNNVQGLPFSELYNAIKRLSEETGISWQAGEIQRIDIGESFTVSGNVRKYFLSLLDTQHYDRNRIDKKDENGVRYNYGTDGVTVFTFYDKTKEALTIPDYLDDPNKRVIRIEMRIMKNVRRTTYNSIKFLKVANLITEKYHKKLATMWGEHYDSIVKKRELKEHNILLEPKTKSIDSFLIAYALHEMSYATALDWLSIIAEKNKWSTIEKSKAKAKIHGQYNSDITSKPNRFIKELDSAVKAGQIYSLYLK